MECVQVLVSQPINSFSGHNKRYMSDLKMMMWMQNIFSRRGKIIYLGLFKNKKYVRHG